jgi:hypothetical protein
MLFLHFVHEVEVSLVEVVDTNIAIFSTTGVATTLRICRNVIEWSEMSFYSANLVLKDLVVESGLELSLSRRCCGNISSSLTSTKDDKLLLRSHGSAVEWCVGRIGLENLKVPGGGDLRD